MNLLLLAEKETAQFEIFEFDSSYSTLPLLKMAGNLFGRPRPNTSLAKMLAEGPQTWSLFSEESVWR